MYFLKHTFACVLWFSDVQPTTHRVVAVLRSSQRLKPGRSRWENSLDMRTDGFPVPRTSAETEILKSLWVWNCVLLIFCRDTLTHPTICTLNFHIFVRRECVETCRPCPRTALEQKHCRKKCSCRQGPPADSWGPKSGGSPPIYDIFCMAI